MSYTSDETSCMRFGEIWCCPACYTSYTSDEMSCVDLERNGVTCLLHQYTRTLMYRYIPTLPSDDLNGFRYSYLLTSSCIIHYL